MTLRPVYRSLLQRMATSISVDDLLAKPRKLPLPKPKAFVDGACLDQANKLKRVAGSGVYLGPDHPLNVSEPVEGAQTNQRAELKAMIRGMQQSRAAGYDEVEIFSDSTYAIGEVERFFYMGDTPSTKTYSAKKPNLDLLDQLAEEMCVWDHNKLLVTKIEAHAGHHGNEMADQLAKKAALAAQVAKKKREEDESPGHDPDATAAPTKKKHMKK